MEQSPQLAGPAEEEMVPGQVRIDGEVPTWERATDRFVDLVESLEETEEKAHRVLDYDCFTDSWASAAWSELYRIDQKAAEWANATVLIEFSGSYWLDKSANIYLPPVTFLKNLQSSKGARQKALSRALEDVEQWQSIRVIGGSGFEGYPRVFLGLYLSSMVRRADFEPVFNAHTNNCRLAGADAHDDYHALSIDIEPQHRTNLVHALGQKIPGMERNEGITESSREKQKMAAVLRGGRWRPYSFGVSI